MSEALDVARELEAEDTALAAQIETVDAQQRRTRELGAVAAELAAFEAALPSERERLRGAVVDAELDLADRNREHDLAEQALETATGEDAAEARRALVRLADAAAVARHRVEHLHEDTARLESGAAALPGRTDELAREAAGLAPSIFHGTPPEIPPGPAGLVEWASRARAALLVTRSGLDTRREIVVREALELAAVVLGEPGGASVTAVRERIEREHR